MDPDAGSERLDPGINLESRPDSLLPINVVFNELAHDGDIVCLEDSENVGASFSGTKSDKRSLLFKTLKASEVFISIRSTLHKSIRAVSAPQDETCHSKR
jgi:hypothetical protein